MASSRKTERREVEAAHIEITTYCHATEDCSKVETAIRNIIHPDLRNIINVNYTWLEGYYGNPIGVLNVVLSSKNYIEPVLNYIAASLNDLEKTILKSTFNLRFDSKTGRFVIRLSKQDLYRGEFRVVDSDDVVKVVIHIRNAKKRENVVEYLKSVGLII